MLLIKPQYDRLFLVELKFVLSASSAPQSAAVTQREFYASTSLPFSHHHCNFLSIFFSLFSLVFFFFFLNINMYC